MDGQQHWQDAVARRLVATALDDGAALLRWLVVGLGEGAAVDAALDAGVERVDGVDPDPEVVRAAGERFDRAVVGLRIGDAHELGGYVGPYDLVLAPLSVDVTRPDSALRTVHDVLSYGSRAWVAVRARGDGGTSGPGVATRDELQEAADAAGWTGSVQELDVPDVPFTVLAVATDP